MDDALPPWLRADLLPEKPDEDGYGCIVGGKQFKSTREGLINRCREQTNSQVMLVWAPETERVVPAIELPFLRDAIRERMRKSIRSNLGVAYLFLFLYGLPLLLFRDQRSVEYHSLLLLSFAILPLIEGWWQLRKLRADTPEMLDARIVSPRYSVWINRQRKVVTCLLLSVIGVVFILQMIDGLDDSIRRAGLTKSGLQAHDGYRFFTATLMHGGFMHLLMNAVALLILGITLEALLGGAGMALVFAVSALGGSLLSFACTSQTTVGASGGIMGLLGCLVVVGFRFRKIMPPRMGRGMIYALFLTALTGFVARNVIDNAAHGGGLITGAALGWALVRAHSVLPLRLPPVVQWAGRLAIGLIIVTAAFYAVLVFRTR